MYNRNGDNASGFWLIVGGVLVGLIMAYSMDWRTPCVDVTCGATHAELMQELDEQD